MSCPQITTGNIQQLLDSLIETCHEKGLNRVRMNKSLLLQLREKLKELAKLEENNC